MEAGLRELNTILRGWMRRERLRRSLRAAGWGLAAGLVLALIAALVALPLRLLLPRELLLLSLSLALAGLLSAALIPLLRPWQPLRAARYFDRKLGLLERVSTALETVDGSLDSAAPRALNPQTSRLNPFPALLLADALRSARSANPARDLPIEIPWRAWAASAVLAAALISSAWWGRAAFQATSQARLVHAAIAQAQAQVEEIQKEIAANEALTPEQQAALNEILEQTRRALESASSAEDAANALSQSERELRALQDPAAEALAGQLRSGGESLAQAQGSPLQPFGEQLAQGDFTAAGQELSNLDLASLSPEALQALADSLSASAQTLQDADPQLAASLQSAAGSLREGDLTAAQAQLQQAAGQIAQAGAQQAQSAAAARAAQGLQPGQDGIAAAGNLASQGGVAQTGQGASGQGQSSSGGASAGGAGRGEGTGSEAAGAQAGAAPIQGDNGPGDGGQTPYEPVYAPQRLGGEGGADVQLPGQGEPGEVIGRGPAAPGAPGGSSVPYVDVLPAYADAYRRAMDSGQVPASMRDLVRDYFSHLTP